MNNYDCIVIGSGISGLISALTSLNKGDKVLLLESHNNIGGLSKNMVQGRFEFETSIHNLYLNDNNSKFKEVLQKCNVKDDIKYAGLSNVCRVIGNDHDFVIPFGIDNFIKMVEGIVPDSKDSLEIFFELAKECRDAMEYVFYNRDKVNFEFIKNEYNNFMRISNYSVSKVLDTIKMPLEAQEIVNSLWILYGCTETELSFVEYSVFLLNIVEKGIKIPRERQYGVAMTLANGFLEQGGEIRFNSTVLNILVDNEVNGVRLADGTLLYSKKVIVNGSMSNVYGNMIDPNIVPRKALKNINKRILGAKVFSVYLGLNREVSELGLDNYMYLLYNSLDSDRECSNMENDLLNGSQISIVHNNAYKGMSPEGTTMVSIHTLMYGKTFSDGITSEGYEKIVKDITDSLIHKFQKNTGVRIVDYIEEIKVVTPLDTISYNGAPDGCMFGYRLNGPDNLLPRLLNYNNEQYIQGLHICGGYDGDIFGYNSSVVAGEELLINMDGDK